MKRKMLAICTSIAALHLVIGGAVILGGCTSVQEDEPMPSGARIPAQAEKPKDAPEVQKPPVTDTENLPKTVDTPKTEAPVVDDPVVVDEPAVEDPAKKAENVPAEKPADKPVAKEPQKGDAAPAKQPVHRANDIEYTVKKNDTYWGIAQKFGVPMKDLEAYNSIPAKKLRPGHKIMIPATGKKITKPVARPVAKVQKTYEPIPANGIYIVKKNDSYSRIASRFGLRAADIAEYNNLPLSKPIQPNQKLKLPPRRKTSVKAKAPAEKMDAAPVVKTPAATEQPAAAEQPAATTAQSAQQPAAASKDVDPFEDFTPPAE